MCQDDDRSDDDSELPDSSREMTKCHSFQGSTAGGRVMGADGYAELGPGDIVFVQVYD
jgi:hypothetical protein